MVDAIIDEFEVEICCQRIHGVDRVFSTSMDPIQGAAIRAMQLLRIGTSDDVGAGVAFLASQEAAFITGVVLPVDGGVACRMPIAALPDPQVATR